MAKVSIAQFAREVRTEVGKVVWPSRKETVTTAIMVVIMTSLLGGFFFGIDAIFKALVRALLSLVG